MSTHHTDIPPGTELISHHHPYRTIDRWWYSQYWRSTMLYLWPLYTLSGICVWQIMDLFAQEELTCCEVNHYIGVTMNMVIYFICVVVIWQKYYGEDIKLAQLNWWRKENEVFCNVMQKRKGSVNFTHHWYYNPTVDINVNWEKSTHM